jgi:hypothetical protein
VRTRRVVLSLLALGLVATGSSATAATKPKPPPPVCNLMTDEPGDGHDQTLKPVSSPTLDIVGGDVATGKKTIVSVLRVKSTTVAGDKVAERGIHWQAQVTVGPKQINFDRHVTTNFVSGAQTIDDSFTVTGVTVDPKVLKVTMNATEIRWTIPRSAVPGLKAKASFTGIGGFTRDFWGAADNGVSLTRNYVDLTPSCLKPA